ncbi:cytochrome P450 [Zychaea mexicana]|uniref:cytochrome P450 n=1 Tax=Zychaea mexicana TaxID=64656 RepID=UPI0022FEF484|nr:cytochrome P450 [Zychaea mexicana]KAI9488241.1 cytochrome P450 [Zychaea mexicana]
MALHRDSDLLKTVSNSPGSAIAITLGAVAGAYLLVSSFTSGNNKSGLRKIPSPKGAIPYLGHLLSLEEVPATQFNKWHKELGPIIMVRMGVKQWVCVSEPHLAHLIFGVNGKYTSARPHTTFLCDYYALGSKGIVAGNPSIQWKKTRGATLQALSPKNRHKLEKLIHPEAEEAVQKLLAVTARDGSVDVSDPFHFASLNVILSTCFGKRAKSTEDPLFHEITYLMAEGGKRSSPAEEMNTFLPITAVLDVIFRKRQNMDKFIREKRNPTFRRLIQECLDNDADCLAKTLFEMEDVNEYENVLVALADSILAGTETTAVMLTWSAMILCHHPEVQKKIRGELDQFVRTSGRLPTYDDRNSLPFSISVQKECMRFRPTTFFGIPHEATEDFEVDGYLIPKGASVVCSMHAIHRDEAFYPDGDKFIPDRFLGDMKPMHTSANAPPAEGRDQFNFGWGRRVCPGAFLAELVIFNEWVKLFSQCVIEPALDENGVPVYPDLDKLVNAGIVTPPTKPIMRVVKRTDALN